MALDPQTWKAKFEHGSLHIEGVAKYPNNFSTAGLERIPDPFFERGVITYRVVFHRDKEPFCGQDLIGSVHHFERQLPADAEEIRIAIDDEYIKIPIPPAA